MELCKETSMGMNDGHRIPVVRFSIYAPFTVPKSKCEEAVKVAMEAGYRHIDGAYLYEKEVGRAIREKITDGMVKTEEIFYPGKLWSTFNTPEMVLSALEKSLKCLQFDYIALCIIHTPLSLKSGDDLLPEDGKGKLIFYSVDLCATWEAMEACKDTGLVKSIGVSNFNIRQLEMILNKPGLKYKPVLKL
ncbi:aldo-keto reductase family 1 member C23-like protein [Terrapene carolina triunguis]|uniref:aldo-keto reductase family 1 member C23-like protein n=1 Tax=Terrapene triunguis TaxID=2587831 RepID=UPI000E77DB35|nr:aldo-keto reductase family 1 member C23-like protein [Terrapene carolina triunguis]